MAATSKLALSSIDLHPWSARGATFDVSPIEQAGDPQRDINGGLHDLSDTNFNKYRIVASCQDLQTPSFNGLRRGLLVTVSCPFEWTYPIPDPEESPIGLAATRTPVAGSIRDLNGWRHYRPTMNMMVINFDEQQDEFGARFNWNLELEEV